MINKKTVGIIVASGQGIRFNNPIPKQYVSLNKYPVLYYSMKKMLDNELINYIRVIIRKEHLSLYDEVAKLLSSIKLLPPVFGGYRRQDSVRIGLESIENIHPHNVIIHDASRPFFNNDIIKHSLEMLEHHVAVVPVVSLTDSVSFVRHDNFINININRNGIKILQTPQSYRYLSILKYHKLVNMDNPNKEFSDDSAIMIEYGIPVMTIEGYNNNLKITTYQDFIRGERCLIKEL